MQIIAIEFTARRYHATPWDAHVNEGRIEWPPCPWRLLRAFLAVGYNKFGWTDTPTTTAVSLIKKLSAHNPSFALPKAIEAHTRHYMPTRFGSKEKSVKVFDAFLRFSNPTERLLIRYNVELTAMELEVLQDLTGGLAYLGRAESWVEGTLLNEREASVADESRKWYGVADINSTQRVRLLASLDSDAYDTWRSISVAAAADKAEMVAVTKAETKGKKLTPAARKKSRKSAEQPYPVDLIAAFQQDTSQWQSEDWPRPPGAQWIEYDIPHDLFERRPLTPLARRPHFTKPEAILLAIDGEGKRGTLRPQMRRTLPLMELLHSEAIRHASDKNLGYVPELTGTDADGRPLQTAHSHAHWIPFSLSGDGSIDHVLVYATGKFSQPAVEAISSIRWAYAKGIRSLSVNVAGQGSIADVALQLRQTSLVDQDALGVFDSAEVWESTTPLVLRKYLHRHGKKTVEGQIHEELTERGFPQPTQIQIWSQQSVVARKLKGFVLCRKPGKRQPPCQRSWGITLRFSRPIRTGPISLGYASHYGLGLFRAVKPDAQI